MTLITRAGKGSALSHNEMDANLIYLDNKVSGSTEYVAVFNSETSVSGSTAFTKTGTIFKITGSLEVLGSITGSLSGSATNAVSSSYALTASYALNAAVGAAFPYTGSALITGSLGVTGSFSTTKDAKINKLTIGKGGGDVPIHNTVDDSPIPAAACCNEESINTLLSDTASIENNSKFDNGWVICSTSGIKFEYGPHTWMMWCELLYLSAIDNAVVNGMSLVQEYPVSSFIGPPFVWITITGFSLCHLYIIFFCNAFG